MSATRHRWRATLAIPLIVVASCTFAEFSEPLPPTDRLGYWDDSELEDTADIEIGRVRSNRGLATSSQTVRQVKLARVVVDPSEPWMHRFLTEVEREQYDSGIKQFSDEQGDLKSLNSSPPDGIAGAVGIVTGPFELHVDIYVDDPESAKAILPGVQSSFARTTIHEATWSRQDLDDVVRRLTEADVINNKNEVGLWVADGGLTAQVEDQKAWADLARHLGEDQHLVTRLVFRQVKEITPQPQHLD